MLQAILQAMLKVLALHFYIHFKNSSLVEFEIDCILTAFIVVTQLFLRFFCFNSFFHQQHFGFGKNDNVKSFSFSVLIDFGQ